MEHKKIKKTEDRTIYMREYMREYNSRKPKKIKLSEEQKKNNLKLCLKKYYDANKEHILKMKKEQNKKKSIILLKNKLKKLEDI